MSRRTVICASFVGLVGTAILSLMASADAPATKSDAPAPHRRHAGSVVPHPGQRPCLLAAGQGSAGLPCDGRIGQFSDSGELCRSSGQLEVPGRERSEIGAHVVADLALVTPRTTSRRRNS